MIEHPAHGFPGWPLCAFLLLVLAYWGAQRNYRFSLLSLLGATLIAAAVVALAFQLHARTGEAHADIWISYGLGALLFEAAGLLAGSFVAQHLRYTGRAASFLAWLVGMTYAWSVAILMLVWID